MPRGVYTRPKEGPVPQAATGVKRRKKPGRKPEARVTLAEHTKALQDAVDNTAAVTLFAIEEECHLITNALREGHHGPAVAKLVEEHLNLRAEHIRQSTGARYGRR